MDELPVACVDMEAGPIAQILNQAKVNMLAVKVISNGIYRDNPMQQEHEYHDNREEVSRVATITLKRLLAYLDGKTVADLGAVSPLFTHSEDEVSTTSSEETRLSIGIP